MGFKENSLVTAYFCLLEPDIVSLGRLDGKLFDNCILGNQLLHSNKNRYKLMAVGRYRKQKSRVVISQALKDLPCRRESDKCINLNTPCVPMTILCITNKQL